MKKVHVVLSSALLLVSSAWSQAQQSPASTNNQAVSNVTGTGVKNYVPLWSSSTKLGDSNIFQTGGAVGIGTTTPVATLDVNGTVNSATGYSLGGTPFIIGSKLGNTFIGYAVGNSTTTGGSNTGIGYATFQDNTTGTFNTALGEASLSVSTTGNDNTGAGAGALEANTTGSNNTATGWAALLDNTTGNYNTATGSGALYFNTTGNTNTAIGTDALELNTTGINNSALGTYALLWNTTGNYNTGAGFDAGFAMDGSKVTGSNNTAIGFNTAFSTGALTNATAVGAYAVVGSDNALVLGCVSGVNTCPATTSVGIGTSTPTNLLTLGQGHGPAIADGWSTYSSRRWKTNIQTLHNALEKVVQLRGVSYDLQANGKHELGVIAEEVGAVVPEVVTFEKNGKDAQSVDYSRLTALLIEATKEQQALIEQQQQQIEQLTSQMKTVQASLKNSGRSSDVLTVNADLGTIRH